MTKNESILSRRTHDILARNAPDVGDYLLVDGSTVRVTHVWDDGYQTTFGEDSGSFYLGDGGHVAYSGSLAPLVSGRFIRTGVKDGRCWFFDRDWPRAGAGVDVTIPFNVWGRVDPTP